jgi:hypothetical protein
MTNTDTVETAVIARAAGKYGELTLTRTSFDVRYKIDNATEWSTERQTSYSIRGDGAHTGGMDEAHARARWARSLVMFNAVEV